MNRLVKLSGVCLLSLCGLFAPRDAAAQCPGGSCGAGASFLSSYYSYGYAWPAYYTTPSYVAAVPMAPAYAVPARIPFVVRRRYVVAPAVPAPVFLPFP